VELQLPPPDRPFPYCRARRRVAHRGSTRASSIGNWRPGDPTARRRSRAGQRSWRATGPHRAKLVLSSTSTLSDSKSGARKFVIEVSIFWPYRALAIARQQSAKLLELRAAISLARLWRDQGKRTEAPSHRSTAGSPKAWTRQSCRTPRRCSISAGDTISLFRRGFILVRDPEPGPFS
jgi:hypothetical protein